MKIKSGVYCFLKIPILKITENANFVLKGIAEKLFR